MSVLEFQRVLEQIKDYTDFVCLHVKGEPLLHSSLDSLLKLCDQEKVEVSLTTNGTLLKSKINVLLKHKCISKIHISLNAERPKDFLLEDIFASVDLLPSYVIVVYRLWAQTSARLDKKSTDVVEKLAKHYSLSTEIVDKIKLEKNTKISFHKYVDKNDLFEWPALTPFKSDGFCEGLKSQAAILSDGTVTACCLDGEGLLCLGNIFDESFAKILASERAQNIISSFRKNKAVEALCQSCRYKRKNN